MVAALTGVVSKLKGEIEVLDWWSEDLDAYWLPHEVVEAYIEEFGVKDHSAEWFEENFEEIRDAYLGEWDSFKEFVQEFCCQLGLKNPSGEWLDPMVVDEFFSYINWDQVVYDWKCSGEYVCHETDRHTILVFSAV